MKIVVNVKEFFVLAHIDTNTSVITRYFYRIGLGSVVATFLQFINGHVYGYGFVDELMKIIVNVKGFFVLGHIDTNMHDYRTKKGYIKK